jgi:uncharacterized protein
MMQSSTQIRTPNASRYLAQLCKHFAHKVDVVEHDGTGEIRFVCGVATLTAAGETLSIDVVSPSDPELAETKDVVERHLVRFAFREDLGPLAWH